MRERQTLRTTRIEERKYDEYSMTPPEAVSSKGIVQRWWLQVIMDCHVVSGQVRYLATPTGNTPLFLVVKRETKT